MQLDALKDDDLNDNPWEGSDGDDDEAVYLPLDDESMQTNINNELSIQDAVPIFDINEHNGVLKGGQFNPMCLTNERIVLRILNNIGHGTQDIVHE